MSATKATDTSNQGVAPGSSTGAPGDPSGLRDSRSQYDPSTTGYNSATGAGYSTLSAGGPHHHHHQPASPLNSYDQAASQDSRIEHAPSTAQRVKMEEEAAQTKGSDSGKFGSDTQRRANAASEEFGRGVIGTTAGIHGVGEALRGTFNAAVDKAVGHQEGVERNQEIARKGEQEIQSGQFTGESNEARRKLA
ncbi:hypothetical protein N7474_003140 [Penicillium riverlandense]|uniref:uncharacterized protein n=1 Tax=Penicillium riverlandense TaxID=1903569 RepID=UPI00254912EF|nr:uncharacterized protein N7474_003140 [Penicillium riverlandense]KAJ5826002.1 hypothetical protein N7474_003140 [Penicillium riverlandense]